MTTTIVKIKADILAAEHDRETGQLVLFNAALNRIAGRMDTLAEPHFTEVLQRLLDAELVEADDFGGTPRHYQKRSQT